MTNAILTLLKIIAPIAIIGWLCVRAQQDDPEVFLQLTASEKQWDQLLLAFGLIFAANGLTFVRWHILLRAVDIEIGLFDTLRLGFMGFLLGFVAPGQIGGDLFKAVFIAREQRQRRTAAVATILIDRICGLYGLLLVAAIGLLSTGLAQQNPYVNMVARVTYACTILGAFGITIVLMPGVGQGRAAQFARRLPRVGKLFRRVFHAAKLFQLRKRVLIMIGALSVGVHLMVAFGLYAGAHAIYDDAPTLSQHLIISPISGVAGALPLFPGGAGSYEAAVNILYDLFSGANAKGRGVVVGLMYRFTTIIVAAVGMLFYWIGRREVADVIERVHVETHISPSLRTEKSLR